MGWLSDPNIGRGSQRKRPARARFERAASISASPGSSGDPPMGQV